MFWFDYEKQSLWSGCLRFEILSYLCILKRNVLSFCIEQVLFWQIKKVSKLTYDKYDNRLLLLLNQVFHAFAQKRFSLPLTLEFFS